MKNQIAKMPEIQSVKIKKPVKNDRSGLLVLNGGREPRRTQSSTTDKCSSFYWNRVIELLFQPWHFRKSIANICLGRVLNIFHLTY